MELVIKGCVFTGRGEGRFFVALDWVQEQVEAKLGFKPFPGTLNLKVLPEDREAVKRLSEAEAAIIEPPSRGFCRGRCYKALLNDSVDVAIVVPEVEGYPEDQLEVIAPQPLREALGLRDGDLVALKVYLKQEV